MAIISHNKNISMNKILLFYLIFLVACDRNDEGCRVNEHDVLKNQSEKVFLTYTSKNAGKEYKDKGKDSTKGGYYYFYPNGNIKGYKFFDSVNRYNYNEQYDKYGNLTKKEGKPLVFTLIKKITNDSINVRLLLFDLNKMYKRIIIQAYDSVFEFKNFEHLENSKLYSNVKEISFDCKDKHFSDVIIIYVDVKYINICTQKTEFFEDTVYTRFNNR